MIGTSTGIRGMVLTLASGILGIVLIPLGIVFAILGATDAGTFTSPVLGYVLLGIGVLSAIEAFVFYRVGRSRAAAEEAARESRGRAQVVSAEHNWNSRVGARHPVKLTIDLGGEHEQHTRTLYVPSHVDWAPGEWIEVAYAPHDHTNFIPVMQPGNVVGLS